MLSSRFVSGFHTIGEFSFSLNAVLLGIQQRGGEVVDVKFYEYNAETGYNAIVLYEHDDIVPESSGSAEKECCGENNTCGCGECHCKQSDKKSEPVTETESEQGVTVHIVSPSDLPTLMDFISRFR